MTMQRGATTCRLSLFALIGGLAMAGGLFYSASVEAATQVPLLAPTVAEKNLKLPVDTFLERLNDHLAREKVGFQVEKPEFGKGATFDVMKVKVGPYNLVLAGLNKGARQIKELMVVSAGDDTPIAQATIFVVISSVLAATTSDLQSSDVQAKLPAILKGERQQHGDVTFRAIRSPAYGTIVTAESTL